MRTLVFEDVAKVLGAAIMTKYIAYQSALWRLSVDSFVTVVQLSLPVINMSGMYCIYF